MRIIAILLILFCTNVEAGTIYLRSDGGDSTQCDGSANVAKNATKKCALNSYRKNVTYSATSTDVIQVGQGSFVISVQPQDIWIPIATFVASPLQYITAVKSGRKVFFSDLGGIAWELQLRKY
jgi:hypothetical protein